MRDGQRVPAPLPRRPAEIYSDALYRPAHDGPWPEMFERWVSLPDDLPPAARARLSAGYCSWR